MRARGDREGRRALASRPGPLEFGDAQGHRGGADVDFRENFVRVPDRASELAPESASRRSVAAGEHDLERAPVARDGGEQRVAARGHARLVVEQVFDAREVAEVAARQFARQAQVEPEGLASARLAVDGQTRTGETFCASGRRRSGGCC